MRTIEDYWQDFEKWGFIRKPIYGGYRFDLPPHLGKGGFTVWGELDKYVVAQTDATLYKPMVVLETVHEKIMEFGQFYRGTVNYYKKKTELFPVEQGLNYLVNHPFITGYKQMDANVRLLGIGITFREKFFSDLPNPLPEDFWETAAQILNPDVIHLPAVSFICDQLMQCSLDGPARMLFSQGKALESFALTLDYLDKHKKRPPMQILPPDRKAIQAVKDILDNRYANPPSISELARRVGLNQQKLMKGFRQINGVTIHTYLTSVRMGRAADLLQSTSMSICEIARAVGYHGDGHFQQAFKKVYGTTPGRLRKIITPN